MYTQNIDFMKGESAMEIFGIPSSITFFYFLGIIGVPIAIEILLHSGWWKKQSDYYYSFNNKSE
jgi:hypothetical protein